MISMTGKFCVSCGKENVELIGRLCPSCYVKSREMARVPKSITITTCRLCGSRKVKGKWVSRGDPMEKIEEEVLWSLTLDEKVKEYHIELGNTWSDNHGGNHLTLRITGSVESERFDETKDILIKK